MVVKDHDSHIPLDPVEPASLPKPYHEGNPTSVTTGQGKDHQENQYSERNKPC